MCLQHSSVIVPQNMVVMMLPTLQYINRRRKQNPEGRSRANGMINAAATSNRPMAGDKNSRYSFSD